MVVTSASDMDGCGLYVIVLDILQQRTLISFIRLTNGSPYDV